MSRYDMKEELAYWQEQMNLTPAQAEVKQLTEVHKFYFELNQPTDIDCGHPDEIVYF